MDDHVQGVVPMLSYADGPAEMAWLSEAFGFEERARWVDESGVLSHGEMSTGVGGLIMLATPTPDYEGPRLHASHCAAAAAWAAAPWVIDGVLAYVEDVVAHFDRAKAAGRRCCPASSQGRRAVASIAPRTWRGTAGCSCNGPPTARRSRLLPSRRRTVRGSARPGRPSHCSLARQSVTWPPPRRTRPTAPMLPAR